MVADLNFVERIRQAENEARLRLEQAEEEDREARSRAREEAEAIVAEAWRATEEERSERMAETESLFRKKLTEARTDEPQSRLTEDSRREIGGKIAERIVELLGRR